jgi:hypothetical protein
MSASRTAVCLGLALAVSAAPAGADEPVLFLEQSDAIAELDGQRQLEISGIQGTLHVRLGTPGELRFSARSRDNRREERPVALWVENDTLRFAPAAGQDGELLLLEVAVPPELSVDIEITDSHLTVSGLMSALLLRGERLAAGIHGLKQPAEIELVESSLEVAGAESELTLEGRKLEATLVRIGGYLSLEARDSQVDLEQIFGDVDVDVVDTSLTVDTVAQPLRLNADGGDVGVMNLRRGGELVLDGAPLELLRVTGRTEVQTDEETRFRDLDGDLVIRSYGGSVRGSGNTKSLQVTTDSAEVRVEKIAGNVRVEGDHLQVHMSDVEGELGVYTTASQVHVQSAAGPVVVENDFGDITIEKAAKKVQVTSRNGNVRISQLSAPLQLTANGDRVEVIWAEVARDGDCLVQNDGGEVWLNFPVQWGGTLDAEAEYGRIESNIPGIVVSDDGNRATGVMRRMRQPRIRVKSGGDVYLNSNAPGSQQRPGG